MAYIKSKDIQLFPSAFRGHYEDTSGNVVFNPASRLTTEYNLTTLSARASRFHQSYVLDYKSETVDKTIIFNIKGYLFTVKMATFLATLTNERQIWAKIKLVDIDSDDIDNTKDTNPVLRPVDVEGTGTLLDEGTVEGKFLGLSLETADPTSALASGEHTLLILEKTVDWDVPAKSYFRMSAKEISDYDDETKSIDEKFKTEDLTVTKINKITITPPSNTSTLTIEDGKTLTVKDNVTLAGTGTATFDKNLTVLGTHNMVLKTVDNNRTLTLKGSPTLSDITTTGSGTLALNKNLTVGGTHNITLETAGANRTLKVSGNNKELAGAGSVITVGGNLTTQGAFDTTFIQGASVSLTLPTTNQTLATIAGTENLTNKTLTSPTLITPALGVATATKINGLTIDTTTGGTLDIANNKTLAVNESITLNADQASSITLPTTGTLATITGTENLTNKTVNGLTIDTTTGTLDIANEKAVAVNSSITFSGTDDKTVNAYVDLDVGASSTNTGKVTIQSAGSSATTITGPNSGEAKLIAGTYGSLATTNTTPPVSGMRMLISTGPNSAAWAVDVLKASFLGDGTSFSDGTSYHSSIEISLVFNEKLNGFYRQKYSDSAFDFTTFIRGGVLHDLSKCFALTNLTFDVPYTTAPNAYSGTTKIEVPFTLGTASSAQTTNYTAVANDSGSTPGVASKIEISADGICTIYVAVVKTDDSSFSVRSADLRFTGSVIQITE